EQMLRSQRPHQRVLDQIVGQLDVAGERPRVASQCRNRGFDVLPESAQCAFPFQAAANRPFGPPAERLDAARGTPRTRTISPERTRWLRRYSTASAVGAREMAAACGPLPPVP